MEEGFKAKSELLKAQFDASQAQFEIEYQKGNRKINSAKVAVPVYNPRLYFILWEI